jgi:hypothetical protein
MDRLSPSETTIEKKSHADLQVRPRSYVAPQLFNGRGSDSTCELAASRFRTKTERTKRTSEARSFCDLRLLLPHAREGDGR